MRNKQIVIASGKCHAGTGMATLRSKLGTSHLLQQELALSIPEARNGTPDPTLDQAEFRKRFLQMDLEPAGGAAEFDRYIGYWKPYATNHEELDQDQAVQDEVRNAAWALLEAVRAKRDGKLVAAGENLKEPRQK
jgi:hypothetical protein